MRTVIVFHIGLFAKMTGSGEKLLRDMSLILADSGLFFVHCVYGISNESVLIPKKIREHSQIQLTPFVFSMHSARPPWKPFGMIESIERTIISLNPSVFISMVSSGDQWPITSLPSSIPMLLVSPFGDFCSNGNVRGLYVSGSRNVTLLRRSGVSEAEIFFNPLCVPVAKDRKNHEKNGPIVFGRAGRNDSNIFDPISLEAYGKLENEFGEHVKYIYVNPSKEARDLVENLKLKNVEFREWLTDEELQHFYGEIDVFAHARRDGETLGVAIAEAMLNSCPVVSHKSVSFNEHLFLVQKPFGFVAEFGDVNGYYEHLRWLVLNREQLPEIGDKARNFARKHFDKETIAKKIITDCDRISVFVKIPLDLSTRMRHVFLRYRYWAFVIARKMFRKFDYFVCFLVFGRGKS
jgi:hypothetical protein